MEGAINVFTIKLVPGEAAIVFNLDGARIYLLLDTETGDVNELSNRAAIVATVLARENRDLWETLHSRYCHKIARTGKGKGL